MDSMLLFIVLMVGGVVLFATFAPRYLSWRGGWNASTKGEEFADYVINALVQDPDGWIMDEHNAYYHGDFRLWIANRPYADLTFGHIRIGNKKQRKRIRDLVDQIVLERLNSRLKAAVKTGA